MTLADALHNHRGALSAALLAEYGIRLREHDLTLTELADAVRWLPPGCALWRATGGPLAWSDELHMLVGMEFRLRRLEWMQTKNAQSGRNAPKALTPPPYARDATVKAEKSGARADAWKRRQARRSEAG